MTVAEKTREFRISHCEDGFDVLTITEISPRKREVTHFALHRNPNAEGAWDLAKLEEDGVCDVYNVLLDGETSTCTCKWGEKRSSSSQALKHCRHVVALLVLQGRGELPE